MKKRLNFMLLFGLLLAASLGSCSDDKEEAQTPAASLVVDNTTVTLLQGDAITVGITSGNGSYAVKTFDSDVATATVSGEKITIQAPAGATLGETTILVTDGRKKSTTITVKVAKLWDLTVDSETTSLFIGESKTIKILTGNGDYQLSLADGGDQVIELGPLSGQVFTIKALKEGETVIVVKDKKDKTVEINIEVKIVDLELEKYTASLNGPGKTTDINILGGNGGYTFTYAPTGIATAVEHQNVITISSVAVGTTTITITDQKGATKEIEVTVLPKDIATDVNTLAITGTKASNKFSITDGNGGYSVASSDNNLMTAAISGSEVTVTAKDAGTGTVTITDAQGKTKQVTVTVNPAAMNLSLDYCLIANYGALANSNDYKAMSQVTLEVRFKLNNIRGLQGFIGLEGNLLLRGQHDEGGGDQNVELVSKLGDTEHKMVTQKILKTNVWYHLALVFDGTQASPADRHKLYVNGELYTDFLSSNNSITIDKTTVDLTKTNDQPGLGLGRVGNGDYRGLNGILAEARVWKVARTSQQIRENACTFSEQNPTGLVSRWVCGYGIETASITDLAGTCNAVVYDNKSGTVSNTKTFPADKWVSSGCPQ